MTDNVTNMLLAQLLLRRSTGQTPDWLRPYLTQPPESRWPLDDEFRTHAPRWLGPEQMHDGEGIIPPEKWGVWPPPPPVLNYNQDPFRRRLEEYDREYPRRPLQRGNRS